MAEASPSDEGWHLVLAHPATEIREEQQLAEWNRAPGNWSGQGKHPVNWQDHKNIRVQDGELGSGSYGVVQRITYRTVTMARKHVKPRRGMLVEKLREEANAMEHLAHKHILKLVGTYTHRRNDLYLLLYPAAVCDLSKLLDDIDDIRTDKCADREDTLRRIKALGLRDVGTAEDLLLVRNPSQSADGSRISTAVGFLQQIMGCITEALVHVHEKGIRHRDLKPKNILLSPGRVYLADFGIARDVRESEDSITSGRCGTPSWIAPEVHDEQDHSMSKADVWSLGGIFLNIATIIYGETLEKYDNIMKERDWIKKYEILPRFLDNLRLKAQKAYLENVDEPTVNPKHVIDLIDGMLKYNPAERPTAVTVNERLLELGGLDQIYHLSCCHKTNVHICRAINRKLKYICDNKAKSALLIAQLSSANDEKQKRIENLESINGTWQQRLENERKLAGERYTSLQEKFNQEVKLRKELEDRLKALETKPARRRGSQNRGRGRSHGLLHPNNATIVINGHHGSGKVPPTKSPAQDIVIGKVQRRVSRVPLPVRPSTPIRPSYNREPGSNSSTLVSSIHSTFSKVSLNSNDSASSVNSETIRSTSPASPIAAEESMASDILNTLFAHGKGKNAVKSHMTATETWAAMAARSGRF